jgi:hypothetical protein
MKTCPPFKPTEDDRKMAEQMAAVGIPQESIARVIGIDPKTLRKHFREELDTAEIKANAKIGGTLFNKAINGDTTAAIWWSKARMGWKERTQFQHADADGEVIQTHGVLVVPAIVSMEEWVEQAQRLQKPPE